MKQGIQDRQLRYCIFQVEPSSQLCTQCTVTKSPFCENHALGSCQEFKKKKVEDRVEFIKIKGLCFRCLKPGHLSISCQSRLTWEESGKLHPTLLHVSKPAKLPAYAVRTLLGWGIIGPIVPTNSASGEEGNLTCHRIATREIGSSKLGNRFTIEAQTKEVINPFKVRRMLELDLSECCNGQPEFSQEDCKFLNIARKGIRLREDSHYEMTLPVKEGTPSLPHNRVMARSRLRPLKKRLESNSTFRSHYVEFKNKLIENGYAEKVSQDTQPDGDSKSAWYITHHGISRTMVYHAPWGIPSKET